VSTLTAIWRSSLGTLVDAEDITPTEYVKRRQKLISDYDDSLPDLDVSIGCRRGAPARSPATFRRLRLTRQSRLLRFVGIRPRGQHLRCWPI
jgi:hypothetical protein